MNGTHGTATSERVDLAALYQNHFEDFVRCAKRLLDTRYLAEDAVQEAFLRFQLGQHKPATGCEVAYLRTCVLNNARTMLRKRQIAERRRPEFPRHVVAVDEACADRDFERHLLEHCERLPGRQRDVLLLRYWHGLSVIETATALAISTGSVKTHASRGRAALREHLGLEAAHASCD